MDLYLFICQQHTVLITTALHLLLQLRRISPPASFFIFKVALTVLGQLKNHILVSGEKKTAEILIGIVLTY